MMNLNAMTGMGGYGAGMQNPMAAMGAGVANPMAGAMAGVGSNPLAAAGMGANINPAALNVADLLAYTSTIVAQVQQEVGVMNASGALAPKDPMGGAGGAGGGLGGLMGGLNLNA